MVRLSPDSRLLVSLVKQEQAYSVQLHNLLNASGTSLSALSVYASSSPSTVSPILSGVAGALSGADEALRNYGEAINDWIDQLRTIKTKEEEVTNIGRDREILVTRLLKVSQKSKTPPPSLLHTTPDSSSNTSFPNLNSKITAAQTELQACESHLAEKERELEQVRIHAVRQGLKLRCSALVRCGWIWSEMGRRALSMLDELNGVPTSVNGHAPEFFKPLSNLTTLEHDRDSLLSSLSPSQSASQIGAPPHAASSQPLKNPYHLDIPPPHLVSEQTVIPRSSPHSSKEPEDGGSSSEDEGPIEVHENPRFQPALILNRQKSIRTAPSSPARGSPVPFPSPNKNRGARSDMGPLNNAAISKGGQDRKHTGLFGSIALLFKTSMTSKSMSSQGSNRWNTRTDQNLRSVKTDEEQSSADDEPQPRSGRLRKGRTRTATVDGRKKGNGSTSLVGAGSAPLFMPHPTAPVPVKNTKSGGKLGRHNTARSTMSEPSPGPRVRANTLTSSSSSGSPFIQNGAPRRQARTASMDGRWGLADVGTSLTPPSHSLGLTPAWKPHKQATADNTLMGIVEGVSSSNQGTWSRANGDPSSTLEVVRAPGSPISGLPLLVHPPPPLSLSISAPSSPTITASSSTFKRSSLPATPTFTLSSQLANERRPLRSALRNANRGSSVSPSTSRSPNLNATEAEQLSSPISPLSLPGPMSPVQRPSSLSRPEIPSTIIESPRQSMVDMSMPQVDAHGQFSASAKTDDSASISSYETGHENLEEEGPESQTPSAPASPPASDKVVTPNDVLDKPSVLHADPMLSDKQELSSATSADTATGMAPTRRKSVRMSLLPPQMSATPPALDDYEDGDRSPWGKSTGEDLTRDAGWKTRIPTSHVGWEDSSSEDEEYKAARRALSRANARSERKKR